MPLIDTLDRRRPKPMIEAKFVETTKAEEDLGINWSGTLVTTKSAYPSRPE